MDSKNNADRISRGIQSYVEGSGHRGVVLGLSGGIDSAVCAVLSANALGGKNVLGVLMPNGRMAGSDERDALEAAKLAGIGVKKIDISPIVKAIKFALEKAAGKKCSRVEVGNVAARTRMILLYGLARKNNFLVLGTGNKSELLLGYFTKYGDGGVDLLPIGDLYKKEVVELAERLRVPERIVRKKPSAGLWGGQTDEGELGFSYSFADSVLPMFVELEMDGEEIIKKVGNRKAVRKVYGLVSGSSHKRSPPRIFSLRLGNWQ